MNPGPIQLKGKKKKNLHRLFFIWHGLFFKHTNSINIYVFTPCVCTIPEKEFGLDYLNKSSPKFYGYLFMLYVYLYLSLILYIVTL